MKKIIFLILTILYPSVLIFSQWSQISTINTPQLNAVKFFDEYTGIAVGQGGIWRSTNGGVNWTQVLTVGRFNAVSFSDFNNGTAVGDSGLVMRTTDNGSSWFQEFSPTTNNLYCVSCPSVNNRFALGQNGVFIRFFITTWSLVSTFGYDIFDIKMLNSNNGYIVGSQSNEIVRSTVNGGTNWLTTLNTAGSLKSIFCLSSSNVIAVGTNSRIRITTNSGISWILPTLEPNHNFTGITFSSNDTVFVIGDNGSIFRSINGGYNWLIQNSPTSASLKSVSFINGKTGWIVGNNGIVLRTLTGGITGLNNQQLNVSHNFVLYQNYPNPFNPTTVINYSTPQKSKINLSVYNMTGQLIKILVNNIQSAGYYSVAVNMEDFPSGVYFYSLYSDNILIETKKCIFIK